MAINTFSTIKTAVANWLHRSDLTDRIDEFITLAENKIYKRLRVRDMETALSDTISSGVISVPSDYLEMKYVYINTNPVTALERQTLQFMYEKYPTRSSVGIPKYIAREAGNFIFGPYPDSGYTVKGVYYAKGTALGTSNESNWITTDIPGALLYGALCEAEPFLGNDPRIPAWKDKFNEIINEAQNEDDSESLSGSAMRMVAS